MKRKIAAIVVIGAISLIALIFYTCNYYFASIGQNYHIQQTDKVGQQGESTKLAGSEVLSDWTQYCSKELKFSISYPVKSLNYSVENPAKFGDDIIISSYGGDPEPGDVESIVIYVSDKEKRSDYPVSGHPSYTKMIDSPTQDFYLDAVKGTIKDYHPESFYQKDQKMYYGKRIEISRNNLFYTIDNEYTDQKAFEENEKIINSFKFLDSSDQCTMPILQQGVALINNEIYFYGQKKGYIDGKKLYIETGDGFTSFDGDISKVIPPMMDYMGSFSYDTLEISDSFGRPYGEYLQDQDKINFKCDGPLEYNEDGTPAAKWAYCQTNNKDYLSQYEFSEFSGQPFSTGGGYSLRWYKLYIKKFGDTNLFFFGDLDGEYLDNDETDNAKIKHLSSKEYLDELLQREENKELIKQWDNFVQNVQYVPSDLSKLNKDELLDKLFPALTFKDGKAETEDPSIGMPITFSLKESIQDYFTDTKEKKLLLTVELEGMAHVGGLYHAYLGLFDKDGNLLTPSINLENWHNTTPENGHFGGDEGSFELYDCNGIEYIAAITGGCPNGSCCSDSVGLYRISNGKFENIADGVNINEPANKNPFKIATYGNGLIIKTVPETSDNDCPETYSKTLEWNQSTCKFE